MTALIVLISVTSVFAGNINAAEQTIVDYYNGTISYNGKEYQFTEAAKQQAYDKLMSDDVDLTEAQAASAIRQANANLQQGIDQGYLVEVSKSEADTEDSNTEDSNMEDSGTEKNADDTEIPDSEDVGSEFREEGNQTNGRPVYSDAQQADVESLLKDALEEEEYSTINVNSQQNDSGQSRDWVVTVEQFLKGTVDIVTKNGELVLSAGLPVKNTGYYTRGIGPTAGFCCVFCGTLLILMAKKEKNYFSIPVLTVLTGAAAFVAFSGGLWESETGKWKSVWIMGAPEYVYAADEEVLMDDESWSMPLSGEQYGEMLCEDAALQVPLYYGDTDEILEKGAGTYAGSSLPGQGKEILIGGHDTTFFAPLESIQKGMVISVKTKYGQYQYEVTDIKVQDVMEYKKNPSRTEKLVLYTCYPFGAEEELRNERFFVYASKMSGLEIGE